MLVIASRDSKDSPLKFHVLEGVAVTGGGGPQTNTETRGGLSLLIMSASSGRGLYYLQLYYCEDGSVS